MALVSISRALLYFFSFRPPKPFPSLLNYQCFFFLPSFQSFRFRRRHHHHHYHHHYYYCNCPTSKIWTHSPHWHRHFLFSLSMQLNPKRKVPCPGGLWDAKRNPKVTHPNLLTRFLWLLFSSLSLSLSLSPSTAPIAPTSRELIQSNSTFVQVNLNAWRSAGCAIQYFVVQYKPRTQREFILLSNHVLPEAGNLIITDLLPAKWYTLFLTATNEAGSTEAEYSFSTLTLSGELIPAYPLESLDDFANQVKLLMPAACVIIVAILLAAVTVVLKKKKRILIDHRSLSYAGKYSLYLFSLFPLSLVSICSCGLICITFSPFLSTNDHGLNAQ